MDSQPQAVSHTESITSSRDQGHEGSEKEKGWRAHRAFLVHIRYGLQLSMVGLICQAPARTSERRQAQLGKEACSSVAVVSLAIAFVFVQVVRSLC